MTTKLERPGIFKAYPASWRVKTWEDKDTVAVAVEFVVLAQLDGKEWVDWEGCEEHRVWGDWFVVKRDGTPNITAVKQLAESLGWDGSLNTIINQTPSPAPVQITVKPDDYNGTTSYKVTWINPEDYEPTPGGADAQTVQGLEARFGSLLRAAAGGARPKAAAAPAKKAPPPVAPAPASVPDDIPF